MTDHTQPQNPYASPEMVAEERRRRSPEEMTRVGLGWLLISAVCSLCWYGITVFTMFGDRGVYESKDFAWSQGMQIVLGCVPVLFLISLACVFPAVQRLSQGVDRRTMTVSWLAWIVGWPLFATIYLSPFGVIVWGVSFWYWYVYLENLAWENRQHGLTQLALAQFIAGAAWCVLVLLLMLVVFLSIFNPGIENTGEALFSLVAYVIVALPAAYLVMGIVLLRGVRTGMGIMENG